MIGTAFQMFGAWSRRRADAEALAAARRAVSSEPEPEAEPPLSPAMVRMLDAVRHGVVTTYHRPAFRGHEEMCIVHDGLYLKFEWSVSTGDLVLLSVNRKDFIYGGKEADILSRAAKERARGLFAEHVAKMEAEILSSGEGK